VLDIVIDASPRIAVGLVVGVVLWLVGRGIGALVKRRYCKRGRPSFAHVMSRVIALGFGLLGFLAAATVIFPTVKPVDILGGLGFFSIAVGFAFRDILENLLAGLLLLFRSPFRIGDEVDIEGTRGRVEEINLRETVIHTYEGRKVFIPNATVYKNQLVVQTGYPSIRTEVVVGVAYETDLKQAHTVALDAVRRVGGVLDQPEPLVLVGELGASTVDLQVLFWTPPQQLTMRKIRDEVLAAVFDAYNAEGIEMPAGIVVVQGTPSLKAAVRDDSLETTQAGGVG
jgi:small conductance mechanosensitive channel